jgi:hypothetical protein
MLLPPSGLVDLGQSAVATSLFSSNILFYLESGYFDGPAELKPLLHTWSLAVEEQYYIFFPLLFILIAKVNVKYYLRCLLILGSLSFITSVMYTKVDASAAFYLIPTRAWELFIGSVLALHLLPTPSKRYIRELLSISGMVFIVFALFFYTSETSFPGYAAALPTLGAALIIYAGMEGETYLKRLLSLKPIVFIGLISYSLYLWHWPIIVFTKYYYITELSILTKSIMLVVIFILSVLSWKYIETPFRKKMILPNKQRLLNASFAVSTVVIVCGLYLALNIKLPFFEPKVSTLNIESNDAEWKHWRSCELVIDRIKAEKELCEIGDPNSPLSFIFWGDSHATALAAGVDISARKLGVKGKIATQSACPPLLNIERPNRTSCLDFNQKVIKEIAQSPKITTVILAARWALSTTGVRYKHESGGTVKLVDINSSDNSASSNTELFELGLERTVTELHRLGKNVVLVRSVPEIGYDVPSAALAAEMTRRNINSIIAPSADEHVERTKEVTQVFSNIRNKFDLRIIDPAQRLCGSGLCQVIDANYLLYRDDDHLSTYGSKYVSDMFEPIFK